MALFGRTVLIIDAQRYITTTLALKLRQRRATVLIAHDGREGFQIACSQHLDLICTGFAMPLLNGVELAKKLYATPITSSIPIIMLTARGHRIDMKDLVQTNVRGVLGKPFSAREVVAKLAEVAWERETAHARSSDREEAA